jgi:hypothetical protein
MTTRTRRRVGAGLLICALLGALTLAGCSKNTGGNQSSAPAAGPAPEFGDKGGAAGSAADGVAANPAPNPANLQSGPGGTGTGPTQQQQQIEPVQRSIIYSANMSVTVTDVNRAADDAASATRDAGGSVSADQRSLSGDRSTAQLTLRVPSSTFSSTVEKLARLGTEVSRSIQSNDVTESIVDVDARIATQRASVDRVRTLLARANTIGEVVSIESELTKREADLDSLVQRKDKLSGLVALSTITLTLRGPAAPAATPPAPDNGGFWGGLKSGWHAFLASAKVGLLIVGWLLPWAIGIGVPVSLILFLRRRLRRRPQPALAPAAPALAPPALAGAGVPGPRTAPAPMPEPAAAEEIAEND